MPHGNRKAKQDPKKKRDRHLKRAAAKNGEQTSRRERLRLSDGVIPRDENTIHLAQLPKAVSKHDVKAMLELAFGKVTHVHLDRTLKFGFARFEEEKSKSAAIQMGTIEFLDEKVEMRCGRKGRKEKPETAPEPHLDDKKDDNSDLSREAAENAGRSTATTSTGDEARQEWACSDLASQSVTDTSQGNGLPCAGPVQDSSITAQITDSKRGESGSAPNLPKDAEMGTGQQPTGPSDPVPMQIETPDEGVAKESGPKELKESEKDGDPSGTRASMEEMLEAIRRAATDVLRVNGSKMTLSEMERNSNLGELKKDLTGFSLEQILQKLGRQFKIKEDGDSFQVALANVDWRPIPHKVVTHFLLRADGSVDDKHSVEDTGCRSFKNHKRDARKLQRMKDGEQKGPSKGGPKQQNRNRRKEKKGKGRSKGDSKKEKGKGGRERKRERGKGGKGRKGGRRGTEGKEEQGKGREWKGGKGGKKATKAERKGQGDQGAGPPRGGEESEDGYRSNKRSAPKDNREELGQSGDPLPTRPRKRRVFAPELSELSDGPEDHGRRSVPQATYLSAIPPPPGQRQPGGGMLPFPPPPPLPPPPPTAPLFPPTAPLLPPLPPAAPLLPPAAPLLLPVAPLPPVPMTPLQPPAVPPVMLPAVPPPGVPPAVSAAVPPAVPPLPPPAPPRPARPSGGPRPTLAPHLSTKTKAAPSPRPSSLPP